MKRSLQQSRLELACYICLLVCNGCSSGHELDLHQHQATAAVVSSAGGAQDPPKQHSNPLPRLQLSTSSQSLPSTEAAAQPYLRQQQPQHHQQHGAAAALLQAVSSRKLAQAAPGFKPSGDEKRASKSAGHMSAGHAVGVVFLCLLAMAVLGFSTWKAMQWIERSRRPGYVELQALDTAYHRPWTTI